MNDLETAKRLFLEGLNFLSDENYPEAETRFRQTLEYAPERVSVLTNLSGVLFRQGKIAESKKLASRAVELDENNEQGWLNLGLGLASEYSLSEALDCCNKALAINPTYPEAWSNRAKLLGDLGNYDQAVLSIEKALELRPNYAEAWSIRADLLTTMRRYEEAAECHRKALEIKPDLPYKFGGWLHARMHCCDWEGFKYTTQKIADAIDSGQKVIRPFPLLGIPSSAAQQQACAMVYCRDTYPSSESPLWQGQRYPHERIRLGYFSSDFRNHPMAHLIAEMIERLDRSKFEVMAFSFSPPTDAPIQLRLEKAFDRFIDVSTKNNHEIANLARQLEIDIAVDLNGYTANSRTSIFAMRPAPIQVNHMGYAGTMGADYIDYIIADGTVIPPEHHPFYSEKVVSLPDTYWFNDSTKRISDRNFSRAELGLPDDAFVFCCFNNNYKITPDAFAIWINLLKRIPGSVLWLSAGNETAVTNLRKECSGRGVDPSRLVFAKRMELLSEHFARHRLADLFLDTFYYNAHTTASDALWAGLPVLTCLGETFASRVAASLLNAIGLPELITHTHEEYEALAFELATQPQKLAVLKEKLATNRLTAPLFDTARYTRHIETAYTMMWQRYQAGLAPEHIHVPQ